MPRICPDCGEEVILGECACIEDPLLEEDDDIDIELLEDDLEDDLIEDYK